MEVEQCEFKDVLSSWDKLWPNRTHRKMSSMLNDTEYDVVIFNMYEPRFYRIRDEDKTIGVMSSHRTTDDRMRVRGLYVDDEYRGKGLAKKLIQAGIDHGIEEKCSIVWTLPTEDGVHVYKSLGFEIVRPFAESLDYFDEVDLRYNKVVGCMVEKSI